MDRQRYELWDGETENQRDRDMDRQREKETEGQRDRESEGHREIKRINIKVG